MKIGIFDSGLGGLTVFKKILENVKADYIYFADNKNAPYGKKDKETVKQYVFNNINKLVESDCKIIVVACNTATSLVINDLRRKYPDICIIGIEPAVKIAADEDSTSNILVCATTITINGEKLNNLIDNLNIRKRTKLLALDDLVKFAESKECDLNQVQSYLEGKLRNIDFSEFGYIVLGCTHFPLFEDIFRKIIPQHVKLVDGSIGITKNLISKIQKMNIKQNEYNHITLYMTKEDDIFIQNFTRILGNNNYKYEVI